MGPHGDADVVEDLIEDRADDAGGPVDTVILDVDGTLVDSVYEHAVAWSRAFHDVGLTVSSWEAHRAIGMGSEQLVAYLAGEAAERAVGDRVRAIHDAEFEHLGAKVRLLLGADRVIGELKQRGHRVVVASSGNERDTARALDHIAGAGLLDGVVTGGDVTRGKPGTDLFDAALELVGGRRAAVVGDSPWDAAAGRAAGHVVIGLLTGGFAEAELRAAGAQLIFATPADLLERIDETGLAGPRG